MFKNRFGQFVFNSTTWVVFIVYLCALGGWYVNAITFPIGAIFSVAFAYVWPALLFLSILWWFLHKKVTIFFGILLMLGLPPASATFSIGIPKPFVKQKNALAIRVMHWNCMDLGIFGIGWPQHMAHREKIKKFFQQYSPDVLCLQDFSELEGRLFYSNLQFISDTLQLPYIHVVYRSYSIYPYGKVKMGSLIASKIPFNGTGEVTYSQPAFPNRILWVKLTWQGKPITVVSTHLQSLNLFSHKEFSKIKLPYYMKSDSAVIMSHNMLHKLSHFQQVHALQVKELRPILDTIKNPIVFAADLNSVPASNVYRSIRGNRLLDGFMGTKTGLGNTFNFLLPNLRIDYLMHDKNLKCLQWHHFTDGFFNHDHLIGDYLHL